ncbi:MAG: hypothetical protein FJX92_01765 [Bacteroidetes bacterium]|nr:hypothetical protein [Bacteroidota bacterium]
MKKILFLLLCVGLWGNVDAQRSNIKRLQGVYDSIKAAGIRHPDVVMAQCIQETGWLECNRCCLGYNNLFGFYNKSKKCMRFSTEGDCIAYYKKWQDKRYDKWHNTYPGQDYFHFLKSVKYATGDKYTAEVKPALDWVRKNLSL